MRKNINPQKLTARDKALRTGTALVALTAVVCGIATVASASTMDNGNFSIRATDADGNTAQRGMKVAPPSNPGGGGTTNPGGGNGGTDPGTGPGNGNPGGGGTTPTCAPDAAQEVAKLQESAANASKSEELRTAILTSAAAIVPESANPQMRLANWALGDVAITVDEKAAQLAACDGEDLLSTVSLSVQYITTPQLKSTFAWSSVGSFHGEVSGKLAAPETYVMFESTATGQTGAVVGPTAAAQRDAIEAKLPPVVANEVKKALTEKR